MSYLKKIYPYAKPYKKQVYLNIFFNVLYAIFSTFSLIAVIPVLKVIFEDKKDVPKPVYQDLGHIKSYIEDLLNYTLVNEIREHGEFKVLMFIIGLIIVIFLLKNFCNYMALYFITHLRNGMVKDIRTELYGKITRLPLNYYSKTTKGDVIAKMTTDVNELSNSFMNYMEMIVKEPLTILGALITMAIF
uniref:ABC transporter transmembrane domain-containing protein n=1 Tax=uncultured Flavobacterium sp. TaxID=165435 RepID=UPI0025F81686